MSDELTIGVFDSGLGGLTVLNHLASLLPNASFEYLGDCARLPYGIKSKDVVYKYAKKASRFFRDKGITNIVFACNTLSALALPLIKEEEKDMNFIGILEPSAEDVVRKTKSGNIAIIATESTLRSMWYQNRIKMLNPNTNVITRSCGLFVSLVEEGLLEGKLVRYAIENYLESVLNHKDNHQAQPDCLLLGCTHFPLLMSEITKVLPNDIVIVNPSRVIAECVSKMFPKGTRSSQSNQRYINLSFTDEISQLSKKVQFFLDQDIKIDHIDIIDLVID